MVACLGRFDEAVLGELTEMVAGQCLADVELSSGLGAGNGALPAHEPEQLLTDRVSQCP